MVLGVPPTGHSVSSDRHVMAMRHAASGGTDMASAASSTSFSSSASPFARYRAAASYGGGAAGAHGNSAETEPPPPALDRQLLRNQQAACVETYGYFGMPLFGPQPAGAIVANAESVVNAVTRSLPSLDKHAGMVPMDAKQLEAATLTATHSVFHNRWMTLSPSWAWVQSSSSSSSSPFAAIASDEREHEHSGDGFSPWAAAQGAFGGG